jgi:hypothetical protein
MTKSGIAAEARPAKVPSSISLPTKQPVANDARNVRVTEAALATAPNTSYMAEQRWSTGRRLWQSHIAISVSADGMRSRSCNAPGALRNRSRVGRSSIESMK